MKSRGLQKEMTTMEGVVIKVQKTNDFVVINERWTLKTITTENTEAYNKYKHKEGLRITKPGNSY